MRCAAVSPPAAAAAGPAADLAVVAEVQAAEAQAVAAEEAAAGLPAADLAAGEAAAGAVAAGAAAALVAAAPLGAAVLCAASPAPSATRSEDFSLLPREGVSGKAAICSRWRPGVSRTFQGSVLSPVLFVEEACSPTPAQGFQGPENKSRTLVMN